MKRFYRTAAPQQDGDGFAVHLDGKPVKRPLGQVLRAPTARLAAALAAEWTAQGEMIVPETMPLTQIVTTALEQQAAARPAITRHILNYLDTDLLCYRAAAPEAVAGLQDQIWTPWLRRFEQKAGCVLQTTTSLTVLAQPQAAHDYAAAIVSAADAWRFTALQMATAASGSLILALAFVARAASPEDVFRAAQLEELYRNDLYHEDFYGKAPHQEKAQAALLRDITALRLFLDLL